MSDNSKHPNPVKRACAALCDRLTAYWRRSRWHKVLVVALAIFLLCLSMMYGIARWYIAQESNRPLQWGVSFIPAYAESLGLDPQQTMDALIDDVGVRRFRLVSYWDQLEPTKGAYDFSLLDWQFKKAEAVGAKITLSLGLRQPRWPECHPPGWITSETPGEWGPQLNDFIAAVVDRYKNSPSLESYQLENEYFLQGFGLCTNFDRQRLVDEYSVVKKHDAIHTLIVSRSNNAIGIPIGDPQPDEYAFSIYKRVWDATFTHDYLEYPFPAWYYAFLAGTQKILTGRASIIHELQAEAYAPNYRNITDIDLAEQNKSFNAERFRGRLLFAEGTGMREAYLWGGEYWYYRLVKLHDPSLWNVAKDTFRH